MMTSQRQQGLSRNQKVRQHAIHQKRAVCCMVLRLAWAVSRWRTLSHALILLCTHLLCMHMCRPGPHKISSLYLNGWENQELSKDCSAFLWLLQFEGLKSMWSWPAMSWATSSANSAQSCCYAEAVSRCQTTRCSLLLASPTRMVIQNAPEHQPMIWNCRVVIITHLSPRIMRSHGWFVLTPLVVAESVVA